jgi:ParB-like chromosome segregation protein Spo0J
MPNEAPAPAVLSAVFETRPIAQLLEHPRNVRRGDLPLLTESLEAHGFLGALVVQASTGFILVGNHRFQAAKALGYQALPVQVVDVDDAHALRILLADNRTNDLATNREDRLVAILRYLAEEDALVGSGYAAHDLTALLAQAGGPLVSCPRCGAEQPKHGPA